MERIRYRFFGHVQHRGFRYACLVSAERAGLVGWVRNEPDGTVIAECEGDAAAQLAFIHRLTTIVTGHGYDWTVASEQEIEPKGNETSFVVRR